MLAGIASIVGRSASAQTTYTWDAVGVSTAIEDGGNWVDGSAPSLQNLSTSSDSAIFSATSNKTINVANVGDGNYFETITFDSLAPAYTFSPNAVDPTIDLETVGDGSGITNNSSHVQTFTLRDVALIGAATLNAANGDPGTHASFQISSLYFGNGAGVTGSFDTVVDVMASGGGTRFLKKSGSGTLILTGIGADGTGRGIPSIGDTDTTVAGPFGAVRALDDNALGSGGSLANQYTRILGDVNSDGRLELAGGITTNEGIYLFGRHDGSAVSGGTMPYNNVQNVAVSNFSGDNTMTGPFLLLSGGNSFNFGSTTGTLTVSSSLTWSDAAAPDGDPLLSGTTNYLTFQGAGNGIFSGNLSVSGGVLSIGVVKSGAGTMTLGGSANTGIGNLIVRGGTLALASSAGLAFVATSADTGAAPLVHLDGTGTTFDVSAIAGGYTLTQNLHGTGAVAGTLAMAAGTKVQPGGGVSTGTDGFTPTGFAVGVGQLSLNSLDMSVGSQLEWNLSALSTNSPGVNFDMLTVAGNLKLGGSSSLALDFSLLPGQGPSSGNAFWNSSHAWKIIDTNTNTGGTNFASIANGALTAGNFTTSLGAGADAGDIFLNFAPGSIPGDYNADGKVDARDYVVWRKDPLSHGGTPAGYNTWRANFGAGSGAGSSALRTDPVPEPETLALVMVSALGSLLVYERRILRAYAHGAGA
jgi:autotransporter-associated beta strand protein